MFSRKIPVFWNEECAFLGEDDYKVEAWLMLSLSSGEKDHYL
jgi:hypothetical protein